MSETTMQATRWVSVDGAHFDLERGEWASARATPRNGDAGPREGFLSVEGGWFDLARSEWGTPPWLAAANGARVVPEGFVSVDGALLPVEPS